MKDFVWIRDELHSYQLCTIIGQTDTNQLMLQYSDNENRTYKEVGFNYIFMHSVRRVFEIEKVV